MKILPFPFAQIRTHKWKSFWLLLSIFIFILLIFGLLYSYKNIVNALTYYSTSNISEPNHVDITTWGNILTMFTHANDMSQSDISGLLSSPLLEDQETFSLVEYPILAKFWLFSFALETDIPVFAYSGKALTGSEIGISRRMLDYYNLQLAGSSSIFPAMNEMFLRGQKVALTVWASKLFKLDTTPAATFEWVISDINPNYPGFWIVIPEEIISKKLSEIGRSLSAPYLISAKIKDMKDREKLTALYPTLSFKFDIDSMKEVQKQIRFIQWIFLAIFIIIGWILSILILYLLSSVFRENTSVYAMIRIFGRNSISSKILTLWEPVIILLGSVVLGGAVLYTLNSFLTLKLSELFKEKWFLFNIIPLSTVEILCILLFSGISIFIILIIFDSIYIKKKL